MENTQNEDVTVDELFGATEEETQSETEGELPEDEQENEYESEGDDEVEEDEGEQSKVNPLQEELEKERKRREDTQKWANEANAKLKRTLEVLKEKELLSEEELSALSEGLQDEQTDTTFQDIGNQINEDISKIGKLLERQGKKPHEYVEAFGTLAMFDSSLQKQLLETPADERTAFVLEKGEELLDTYNFVKGKNSVLEVIREAVSERDKIREQVRKELEAEYEAAAGDEQYHARPRPKLKGSNVDAPDTKDAEITNAKDLFIF